MCHKPLRARLVPTAPPSPTVDGVPSFDRAPALATRDDRAQGAGGPARGEWHPARWQYRRLDGPRVRQALSRARRGIRVDPSTAEARITRIIERIDADEFPPLDRGRNGPVRRENRDLAEQLAELYGIQSPVDATNRALREAIARIDAATGGYLDA